MREVRELPLRTEPLSLSESLVEPALEPNERFTKAPIKDLGMNLTPDVRDETGSAWLGSKKVD